MDQKLLSVLEDSNELSSGISGLGIRQRLELVDSLQDDWPFEPVK